ncbi:MAG: hypothetical protein HZA93_20800 [Verrucomicrobia bacterium]|nr:hypothetical protein [Verrucomicrobiota bacterium]
MSSLPNTPCGPSPRRTDRGSAIVTVLVLAAVTAVVISGFLFRSAQEARMATRSFYNIAALHLAEAAVEELLHASNTGIFNLANGWTALAGSTTSLVKTVSSGINLSPGIEAVTGQILMRVDNFASSTPTLVAAGVVTIPGQPSIVKQLRVSGTKQIVWSGGVVAADGLTFNGSDHAVDGYDSETGVYDAVTNITDRGSVVTRQCTGDGTARIWGYATRHGSYSWSNRHKVKCPTTPANVDVDPSRMRTDFNVNLVQSTAPSCSKMSLGTVTNSLTLPRAGDSPNWNGKYVYSCSGLNLDSTDVLDIKGPVILVVTDDITLRENARLRIGHTGSTDASLNLYFSGDIDINGYGIDNLLNVPGKCLFWGTHAYRWWYTPSVRFRGWGRHHRCAVYASRCRIRLDDDELHGSVICKNMDFYGTSKCHYDTKLATIASDPNGDSSSAGSSTIRLGSWVELTQPPGSGGAFARDNTAPFNTLF